MKRKTLTIISIVSIIIISLILLGVTYGYFLTNITGNEHAKSVEVVTGDSRVLYTDLSTEDISEIIEPGFKTVKSFTVKNTGDVTATYSIYLVDVINSFNRTQDITYNLYKKEGTITDVTIATDLSETNGWSRVNTTENKTFPAEMSVIAPNEVIETPNQIYTYVLKVEYIDHPTENQNEDQGKIFAFKVNIRGEDTDINPFSEGTLAYNILNNSIINKNGTTFVNTQSTDNSEKILSVTTDDYGTSYYYKGGVIDNYVNFAGMCWKIVRIEGDKSIKLILEDKNEQCNDKEGKDLNNNGTYFTGNWSDGKTYNFGHINYGEFKRVDFINYTGGLADSFKTFQTSLAKKINTDLDENSTQTEINNALATKLKIDEWCYDDKVTSIGEYGYEYYGAYTRSEPSLKCTGTKLTTYKDKTDMYVGTLTADEMLFAGVNRTANNEHYLMNSYSKENLFWSSLSPYYFYSNDYIFSLNSNGEGNSLNINSDTYSRPAITLKDGTKITGGEGTIENPYIIG